MGSETLWVVCIVATIALATSAFWGAVMWRVFTKLQAENRTLIQAMLVIAPSAPDAQPTQGAAVASQMVANDLAEIQGSQPVPNHRRTTERAAM